MKLEDIKVNTLQKRSLEEGISNGKPFETLCTNDLDWLRFATKELDLFRWKNTACYYCGDNLTTKHLKTCQGTKKERKLIENKTGIDAVKLLEDPSILNSFPKDSRKSAKSFVAERISKMIHSAGRRIIV